jgi:hypothetical protein
MKSLTFIAGAILSVASVLAQEGATVPTAAAGTTASYSCDPNACKIESNCHCASTSAPGGLTGADVPQVCLL